MGNENSTTEQPLGAPSEQPPSPSGKEDALASTQSRAASTQSRAASTQSRVASTQSRPASIQSGPVSTHSRAASTQSRPISAQSRAPSTQSRPASIQTRGSRSNDSHLGRFGHAKASSAEPSPLSTQSNFSFSGGQESRLNTPEGSEDYSPVHSRVSYQTPQRNHSQRTFSQQIAAPMPVPRASNVYLDPVMAAAAAGAAAKRSRENRRSRPSPQISFNVTVDNEWKASLRRFARTAAETARTVAKVAEPAMSEAVQAVRTSAAVNFTPLHQSHVESVGGHTQGAGSNDQKTPLEMKESGSLNPTDQHHSMNPELLHQENAFGAEERKQDVTVAPEQINQELPARHSDSHQEHIVSAEPINQEHSVISGDIDQEHIVDSKAKIQESPAKESDETKAQRLELEALSKNQDEEVKENDTNDSSIGEGDATVDWEEPLKAPTTMRRSQAAPVVSTPLAFGGEYGTAYSTQREPHTQGDGAQSPMSMDEMLLDSHGIRRNQRRRPFHSATDWSSVGSSYNGEDSNLRQLTFHEQLMATPKQFVDLVSKRLSEDQTKSGRYRKHRGRGRSHTPSSIERSWTRNGSRNVDDKFFDRQLKNRSPSISPPDSPISAAMHLEESFLPTPVKLRVDLWDMIPARNSSEHAPELEAEHSSHSKGLPGPMLKQTVLLDPPPAEFLGDRNPASSALSSVNEDEWSGVESQERLQKRKSEQIDKFDVRSYMSCSFSSGGSVKRSRLDRKKASWRRRATRPLDRRFDHGRTPSKSPRAAISRDVSPEDENRRKKRMYQPDSSGLFAEADASSLPMSDEDDEMLNEALMAFSTMTNLSLTNEFPKIELPGGMEYVASIRWRQLLANWKHHELMIAMTRHPTSLHFADGSIYEADSIAHWSASASTTSVNFFVRNHGKVVENQSGIISTTKNCSGLTPSYPFELQNLSRFTTKIGLPFAEAAVVTLKQIIEGTATVERLLHMAGDKHGKFSSLIEQLAVFASQDYKPTRVDDYEDTQNVSYSIDIKDARAIQMKADSKYDGDLLQVKDILRAQVVFPTESSLICAFTFLNQYCKLSSSVQATASNIVADIGLKSEIVRIKNLFGVTSDGQPCLVELPTGYRHLLLNLRLDDVLLAEIQFHLAPFYDVLGDEGYHLHREILDANLEVPSSPELEMNETSWDSTLTLLDGFVKHHSTQLTFEPRVLNEYKTQSREGRLEEPVTIPASTLKVSSYSSKNKGMSNEVNDDTDRLRDEVTTNEEGKEIVPVITQAAVPRQPALSKEKKVGFPFAGGGIATAAAQAAAARQKKDEASIDAKKPDSPFAGGGIAAAAAQAAAARQKKDEASIDTEKPVSPFAGGGIAAAAAQAAAARQKKDEASIDTEKPVSPFAGGGIAAAAAQAAAARQKKDDATIEEVKPVSPFAGGGIAAAAAQAAAARQKKDEASIDTEKPVSPFAGGGIAAAAAQAAAARQKKDEASIDTEKPVSPFAGGGIAAAAAQAAAARQKKDEASIDTEKPVSPFAGGGIAAAAAQAAAARQKKDDATIEEVKPVSPFAGGGIAAAAAQAAAARQKKDEASIDTEKPVSPFAGGGIAAAAAQAAAARQKKDEASIDTEKPVSPFAGGGIAAAAAQAAATRQKKSKATIDEVKPVSPFAGGGIAAAAAQAAAARQKKTRTTIEEDKPMSPFAGEGIAAAAAQAAAARQKKDDVTIDEVKPVSPFAGGGIAAAAAQAAAARNKKPSSPNAMASKESSEIDYEVKLKGPFETRSIATERAGRTSLSLGGSSFRGSRSIASGVSKSGSIFIPGITGKARCLDEDNSNDGLDTSTGGYSSPSLDSKAEGDDRSVDDNSDFPAFFIPGITGQARCLTPLEAPAVSNSNQSKRHMSSASLNIGDLSPVRGRGTRNELSTSRRSRQDTESSVSPSRLTAAGTGTLSRSYSTDSSMSTSSILKTAVQRRRLPPSDNYTSLSRYSPMGTPSGPYSRSTRTRAVRRSRQSTSEMSVDTGTDDSNDGDGSNVDAHLRSGNASTSLDGTGSSDDMAEALGEDTAESSNDGIVHDGDDDLKNKKREKKEDKKVKKVKKKAEKKEKKKSKYSELVDDQDYFDVGESEVKGLGFHAIEEENSQKWDDNNAQEISRRLAEAHSIDSDVNQSENDKKSRTKSPDDLLRIRGGAGGPDSELEDSSSMAATGHTKKKNSRKKKKKIESGTELQPLASVSSPREGAKTIGEQKRTKSDEDVSLKSASPFAGGGIAAAAAMAAAARSKGKASESDVVESSKGASPFAGGGIAAAAAMAAAARSKGKTSESDGVESSKGASPFAGGGIAAAAAMAAAARSKGKTSESDVVESSKGASPFAGGGIAAAAAMAAAARSKGKTSESDVVESSKGASPFAGGGIAAAAAMAAAARSKGKTSKSNVVESSKEVSPFAGGGIAAAAAMAAAARSKGKASESDGVESSKEVSPFAGGGIAAAAAMAAAARSKGKASESDGVESSKGASPFAGGGIAAAAAMAAAARSKGKASESDVVESSKEVSPFAGGGIAAAAAMAAAARSKGKASESDGVESSKGASPFAGGGIAAAAAMAAAARSKGKASESDVVESSKGASPFAGGGIAAAAAMAAAARSKGKASESDEGPSVVESSKGASPFAGGGIAAAAAMAAASRSKESEIEGNLSNAVSTVGNEEIDAESVTAEAKPAKSKGVGFLQQVFERNAPHPGSGTGGDTAGMTTSNDVLLAILTVALQRMSVESRDLASLHCMRVLCEYVSHVNGIQKYSTVEKSNSTSSGAEYDRIQGATTPAVQIYRHTGIGDESHQASDHDLSSIDFNRSKSIFAGDKGDSKTIEQDDVVSEHTNETTNLPFGRAAGEAARAAVAEAKQKDATDLYVDIKDKPKSPFSGGGIAAAAAAAAAAAKQKKTAESSTNDEDKPKSPFAGGGIAAAAAAAAAAKQKKAAESSINDEDKPKSPFAGGGIAAAAAAAAAAKQKKAAESSTNDEDKPKSPFAGGGIAAAAAAAAAAKQKKAAESSTNDEDKPKSPFAGGGIAAAAAAAAAAKQKKAAESSTNDEDKPKSPFAGGGIAAAAAAAAAAKQKKAAESSTNDEDKPKSPFAGGGIAAAAAAAAAAKQKKAAESSTNDEDKPKSPFAGGGIAAAAAAAAAAKQKKAAESSINDEDKPKSPFAGGGIAAAAAAAAAAKQKKAAESSINDEDKPKSPFAGGGIAAAAAAAAAAKQKKAAESSTNDEDKPKSPFAGGGIAAAAAAAAAAKQKKAAESSINDEDKPKSPFAGGGIAAAAAAAAAAKQKKAAESSTNDEDKPKSPFAGGGIAAAAAAAAAAKQKKAAESSTNDEDKPKSPFAGGGIAAAAAAAAAAKQKKAAESRTNDEDKPKSPFAGGGIAAAAAAAAAAKQKKAAESSTNDEDKPKSPFAGGGIAAAAAAAAAAKQKKAAESSTNEEDKPKSPFAGGGIAAAAAAAAAAKQKKAAESSTNDEDKPKSPFAGGGIAAAAAAAAAAKQRKAAESNTYEDNKPKPIAAAPAATSKMGSNSDETVEKNSLSRSTGEATAGVVKDSRTSYYEQDGNKPRDREIADATNVEENSNFNNVKEDEKVRVSNIFVRNNFAGGGISASAATSFVPKIPGIYGDGHEAWEAGHGRSQFSDSLPSHFHHCFARSRLPERKLVPSGLTNRVNGKVLNKLQEMTLLRSLSLSNQTMSVGMAGWLEYGSSDVLDRSVDRAFEVMENLASLHAQQGRWAVAVDVLRALVMKCEQHLPLYHPLTLVSMLDLAAALAEVSENDKARKVSSQVLQRLALYLSEQEEHFLDARNDWLAMPVEIRIVFQKHTAADFVVMIAEFVKALLKLQKRDILRLVHSNNSLHMLNYSVTADALSVLANCTSLIEEAGATLLGIKSSESSWELACQYYRRAFEGWSKAGQSLHHPNTCALVCGLARCLRETGHRPKAIRILEAVVLAREKDAEKRGNVSSNNSKRSYRDVQESGTALNPGSGSSFTTAVATSSSPTSETVTFLPPRSQEKSLSTKAWSNIHEEQIHALCVWSLAVYQMEENRNNERQRIQALNMLHASAQRLRAAIQSHKTAKGTTAATGASGLPVEDAKTNLACVEMLHCIEEEARELFQPLEQASLDFMHKSNANSKIHSGTGRLLNNFLHHPSDTKMEFQKRLENTARRIQGRFVSG